MSILLATIAAFESTRLLFFFVILFYWFLYKQIPILLSSSIIAIGICTFFLVELVNPENITKNDVNTITWTDNYRINGGFIRGFAASDSGQKWYVQLKISDEQDKVFFSNYSLTGWELQVKANSPLDQPLAHRYAFDMESYIKSHGAVGQLNIDEYELVSKKYSFRVYMAEQRYRIKQHIQRTFPNSLQAEAEALLIGSRESMPLKLQDAYQTLGITHLFAISGLHVALVVLLLHEVLIRLGVRRKTANWLLIIVLPLYGLIAGGAPSVWRAVSVTEILLISGLFKRKLVISDAFCYSFIGFLLYSPWIIYQVGFQLSYLAAFSLIFSASLLKLGRSYITQSFILTAVCQLIVYPILIYQFNEISLSSFIANLLFVPLFSFIVLPINIILLLITFLSPSICNLVFLFYEPIRLLLDDFILYIGSFPYQVWNPIQPKVWYVVIVYVSVITFFILLEKKKSIKNGLLILFTPIILLQLAPYLDSSTRITFLNVGQGDSIVIEMPYREAVIMIDTGGVLRFDQEAWKESNNKYEVGRQVVVPFLKGRGIRKIDTMVLSHADADHMEGAEEVLQEVKVGEIHISPGSYEKAVMHDLREEINLKQIPVIEKFTGESIESSYYNLSYLYPMDNIYEGNNDSLVLSMSNDYFKGLFIGDLEREGEIVLSSVYPDILQDQTVLKLGHHGSKTSSTQTFLEVANPHLAVISAGFNNRYGHPHSEVLERLQALKIPFLQTGIDGAIEIIISKEGEVTISTH